MSDAKQRIICLQVPPRAILLAHTRRHRPGSGAGCRPAGARGGAHPPTPPRSLQRAGRPRLPGHSSLGCLNSSGLRCLRAVCECSFSRCLVYTVTLSVVFPPRGYRMKSNVWASGRALGTVRFSSVSKVKRVEELGKLPVLGPKGSARASRPVLFQSVWRGFGLWGIYS